MAQEGGQRHMRRGTASTILGTRLNGSAPIFVNEYAQQIFDIICSATIHLTSEDFYEAVWYCFVEMLRGQRQVGDLPPVAVAGHWNISVRGPSRCLRFMRPY